MRGLEEVKNALENIYQELGDTRMGDNALWLIGA
jgi:hypothetical protein